MAQSMAEAFKNRGEVKKKSEVRKKEALTPVPLHKTVEAFYDKRDTIRGSGWKEVHKMFEASLLDEGGEQIVDDIDRARSIAHKAPIQEYDGIQAELHLLEARFLDSDGEREPSELFDDMMKESRALEAELKKTVSKGKVRSTATFLRKRAKSYDTFHALSDAEQKLVSKYRELHVKYQVRLDMAEREMKEVNSAYEHLRSVWAQAESKEHMKAALLNDEAWVKNHFTDSDELSRSEEQAVEKLRNDIAGGRVVSDRVKDHYRSGREGNAYEEGKNNYLTGKITFAEVSDMYYSYLDSRNQKDRWVVVLYEDIVNKEVSKEKHALKELIDEVRQKITGKEKKEDDLSEADKNIDIEIPYRLHIDRYIDGVLTNEDVLRQYRSGDLPYTFFERLLDDVEGRIRSTEHDARDRLFEILERAQEVAAEVEADNDDRRMRLFIAAINNEKRFSEGRGVAAKELLESQPEITKDDMHLVAERLAFSGKPRFDERSGEWRVSRNGGADGGGVLALMRLAGIKVPAHNDTEKRPVYVMPSSYAENRITYDSGDQEGTVTIAPGDVYDETTIREVPTIVSDHHNQELSTVDSPAPTKQMYDFLVRHKFLETDTEKGVAIQKFVDFVSSVDNLQSDHYYEKCSAEERCHFKEATMLNVPDGALGQMMESPKKVQYLLRMFEEGYEPHQPLSEEQAQKLGFQKFAQERERVAADAIDAARNLEAEGFTVKTNMGTFLIDPGAYDLAEFSDKKLGGNGKLVTKVISPSGEAERFSGVVQFFGDGDHMFVSLDVPSDRGVGQASFSKEQFGNLPVKVERRSMVVKPGFDDRAVDLRVFFQAFGIEHSEQERIVKKLEKVFSDIENHKSQDFTKLRKNVA